jgi:hypothetical protein
MTPIIPMLLQTHTRTRFCIIKNLNYYTVFQGLTERLLHLLNAVSFLHARLLDFIVIILLRIIVIPTICRFVLLSS